MIGERVIGIDPGAKRLGYAVLEDGKYVTSGCTGYMREDGEKYQDYKHRLIQLTARVTYPLLESYKPDRWISEIQPAISSSSYAAAGQAELVKAVMVVLETCLALEWKAFEWYAATSIKKLLVGDGKATKTKIRSHVLNLYGNDLPPSKKKDWAKVFDESDALAIASIGAGYRYKKARKRGTVA